MLLVSEVVRYNFLDPLPTQHFLWSIEYSARWKVGCYKLLTRINLDEVVMTKGSGVTPNNLVVYYE